MILPEIMNIWVMINKMKCVLAKGACTDRLRMERIGTGKLRMKRKMAVYGSKRTMLWFGVAEERPKSSLCYDQGQCFFGSLLPA